MYEDYGYGDLMPSLLKGKTTSIMDQYEREEEDFSFYDHPAVVVCNGEAENV